MSVSELKNFYNSEEGKKAGLTKEQAKESGISSGRESAEWLMKMIPLGKNFKQASENWTPKMWEWAGKQNSFISRMSGGKGPLRDEEGNKTPKLLSLLIWGHNPESK